MASSSTSCLYLPPTSNYKFTLQKLDEICYVFLGTKCAGDEKEDDDKHDGDDTW